MITAYLKWVAAKRAYSAVQARDTRVFRAWCNGDRSKGPDGTLLTDVLQAEVTKAWRRVMDTREEWNLACYGEV